MGRRDRHRRPLRRRPLVSLDYQPLCVGELANSALMSNSWAIVVSGAIAAAGAVGVAWAAWATARSSQIRSDKSQAAREIWTERQRAYQTLLIAVGERISALDLVRHRRGEESSSVADEAAQTKAAMWRAYRAVELMGPDTARAAGERLVRHYANDVNGLPERGGSDLEREFVRSAQEALDATAASLRSQH
jgi:hypothetical protein